MAFDLSLRGALLVGAGALLGGLARWVVGSTLPRSFPYGTVLVNVAGSYLLALLMFWGVARGHVGEDARLFLVVGFLGAFTTMSAFAHDTLVFIEVGEWGRAAWNFLGNPVLALVAAAAGMLTARLLPGA